MHYNNLQVLDLGLFNDPVNPVVNLLIIPTAGDNHFLCFPGIAICGVNKDKHEYELIERPGTTVNTMASDSAKIPPANQVALAAVIIKIQIFLL